MIEYGDTVEWIRRQHWKNNRNKRELALGPGEGASAGRSRADDRQGVARQRNACLVSYITSRHLPTCFNRRNIIPFHPAMAQAYNDFNQNSPPDHMLALVNEQLLKPTYQQRTITLKNYFLGYKECSDAPPSPAPSDQDQLFSYLDQSNTNLDEVPPISPSRILQNRPEAESQGKDNYSSILITRLIVSTISQS
jgi:hypothetical protein